MERHMTDDEFMRRLAEKRIEQGLNPHTGQPVDPWSEAIVMPKGREVYVIIVDRRTKWTAVAGVLARWMLDPDLSFDSQDYAVMCSTAFDRIDKTELEGLL
jgi:hypothetical protein